MHTCQAIAAIVNDKYSNYRHVVIHGISWVNFLFGQWIIATDNKENTKSRPNTDPLVSVTLYWARWRLKSLAYRLFAQPFVQAQIK